MKIPIYRKFGKFERLFFVFGQISAWNISRDILRGPQLFWSLNCVSLRSGNLGVKKVLVPIKISLEMSHKVICPQKKNNHPHFQNQRYNNSYYRRWDSSVLSDLMTFLCQNPKCQHFRVEAKCQNSNSYMSLAKAQSVRILSQKHRTWSQISKLKMSRVKSLWNAAHQHAVKCRALT